MQSPFGDVSGLQVSGIVQRGAVETVKLAIQLKCDSGLNSINAMVKPGGRSSVNWKGAGTLDYVVPTRNVEISVGYVHSKLDTQKLNLSIVLHFNPHGWVRLADSQLRLEGHQHPVSFVIPHDVEKEGLMEATKFSGITTDIETAYGKRLPEECRDLVKKNQRKPVIYPTIQDVRMGRETGRDPLEFAIERKRARLEDYNESQQFRTIARERQVADESERSKSDALLDAWENPVRDFISRLFNKSSRTRNIIQRWHDRRPIVFASFIESALKNRFSLSLTDTALYIFDITTDAEEFSVPYTWLTTSEQTFCYRLYVNRYALFADVTDYNRNKDNMQYRLRRFRLDASVVSRAMCGEFIVHQFALDCIEYGLSAPHRIRVFLALASAVGKVHVAAGYRNPFLLHLKMALEKPSIWSAVNEMGIFVKIGVSADAIPLYTVSREDIVIDAARTQHRPLPSLATPYRLAFP